MKRHIKRVQRGFTLIELMIVVAIIAILAAIAIPQYQQYTVRAKWAAAMQDLEGVKNAIKFCMVNNLNDGTACNEIAELQTYDFQGTEVPKPKGATAAITLTGKAFVAGDPTATPPTPDTPGSVTIVFTGEAELGKYKYEAACGGQSDGNFRCEKTSGDSIPANVINGSRR